MGWFFTLILFNTLAILDILYIFFFSGPSEKEKHEQQDEVRQAKMRFREQQARKQEMEGQIIKEQEPQMIKMSIQRKRQTIV